MLLDLLFPLSLISFAVIIYINHQEKTRLQNQLQEEIAKRSQAEIKLSVLQAQNENSPLLQQQFSHFFKALSADALQQNNQAFLELAHSTLEKYNLAAKSELDKKQDGFFQLLKPIQETLKSFDAKLGDLEQSRNIAYELIKQQVHELIDSQKNLKTETGNLVKALRGAPHVRGRWGEMQLKRIVELSGMLEHCDFTEQTSIDSEDGKFRPDMLVHLPGEKNMVIDAKTPLSAYLEAIEAPDESQKQILLKTHAQQVKKQIQLLSSKAYWQQFEKQNSPDFVILFLPGEVFFSAALEQDPELIEFAAHAKVILATPTTLIALLRAIAHGWKQENININATKIGQLGKDLYSNVLKAGHSLTKLGKHLNQSVESYNQSIRYLDNKVFNIASKFEELDYSLGKNSSDAVHKNSIDSLNSIEITAHTPINLGEVADAPS
ncbi:MAG: DNA recombination protein RmuC [Gammaproteobacteria bacterium]